MRMTTERGRSHPYKRRVAESSEDNPHRENYILNFKSAGKENGNGD